MTPMKLGLVTVNKKPTFEYIKIGQHTVLPNLEVPYGLQKLNWGCK